MMNILRSRTRFLLPALAFSTYFFLYTPIAILVLYSFNKGPVPYRWGGFSLQWYFELFNSPEIWKACINTVIVAFSAVSLSLLMGVLYVYWGMKSRLSKFVGLFYTGIALPEIV